MKKTRAFLKWAGGKYSLVEDIQRHLPQGNCLIEPFVGAGSVFLNTDYDNYLLNDINPDLIGLYTTLKSQPDKFIQDAQKYFQPKFNTAERYYLIRDQFNHTNNRYKRSLLFLYLNRHGYNGLCRYNQKGGFNVPFGRYTKPYFPLAEMLYFAEKAQKAEFVCESYQDTFARARQGDVIYCDPPYAPLSTTASFTTYTAGGFTLDDQAVLARISREIAKEKGISVLISNHDIDLTRELYRGANLDMVKVTRTISRNAANRKKVSELLALFS